MIYMAVIGLTIISFIWWRMWLKFLIISVLLPYVKNNIDTDLFQLFSILANEFKNSEILTLETLLFKMEMAPIIPRPICKSLLYVYDWKDFVTPNLTELPLCNHSKYHSFIFQNENGSVKFRAKFLPQMPDTCFYPRTGIRLMKPGITFTPVGPARVAC